MSCPPNGSGDNGRGPAEGPTDLSSLLAEPAAPPDEGLPRAAGGGKKAEPEATDFASIRRYAEASIERYQPRTFADWVIDVATPVLIFLMSAALVYFLLDVRYIYTEVHDRNLRIFALFFLVGIVALNRLIAREGSEESFLYIVGLFGVVALYTFATTAAYDVGSVARGFMDNPWVNLGFNLGVVGFLWWGVNRLTHECCVDENTVAGEVGILTGSLRKARRSLKPKDTPKDDDFYDPMSWSPAMARQRRRSPQPVAPTERLSRRHPGISVLIASVPAMAVFALGLRVLQHGGQTMVLAGHLYVGVYTTSALLLLMLTSLSGVRQYFRSRRLHVPSAIAPFWVGLGTAMVVMVLVAAMALPMPSLPPIAYVETHETDFWTRTSTFQLQSVAAQPAEIIAQSRAMEWVGRGVLAAFGVLLGWWLLRVAGKGVSALARRRGRLPAWLGRLFDGLDALLDRLMRLPRLPSLPARRRRVDRAVSRAATYTNPLARQGSPPLATPEAVGYSYDALCALAEDLGVPRGAGETPYEYIERFPKELNSLRDEAEELTRMLVATHYAGQELDPRSADRIRKFWLTYERARRRIIR